MRQLYLGSVAAIALCAAGPAVAADMPARAPVYKAPPAAIVAQTWTGLYVGAHGGYGKADHDGVFDIGELPGDPQFVAYGSNLDVNGGFGGVQIGYLYQHGPWVIGAEFAASFMNWSDKTFDPDPGTDTDYIEAKIENLYTAVAKLGFATNSVLVYGAVGAAWVRGSWTVCDCDTSASPTGSVDFDKVGLAAGGGVTVATAGPWSVGVEGLYLRFNDRQDTSLLTPDSDVGDFAELKNIWIVKGSVNYRFGWGGAPL